MDTGIFDRHERIALQFSGGRDSLAVLYLCREWWDRLTVYWLNPGNPFPETVELMEKVRVMVPSFAEVKGKQKEIVAADGWPSDVVPQAHTTDGNIVFGATPFKVQSRLSCCVRAMMQPMHERMKADGVTCVIRGKRFEEKDKTGVETGFICASGIEYVFPIYEWTASDVTEFLSKEGVAIPESYQKAFHSLDCMDCTAWWGEGLSLFLEEKYPFHYAEYLRRVTLIKRAVMLQMDDCEV